MAAAETPACAVPFSSQRYSESCSANNGTSSALGSENEDPLFGIDVVPFVATSFPDALKLYQASKPTIEKKLAAQGIMLLFAVPWAPQGIYAKKDINSIEDVAENNPELLAERAPAYELAFVEADLDRDMRLADVVLAQRRANLRGLITSAIPIFWNIEK